jgi:hypothetical protein
MISYNITDILSAAISGTYKTKFFGHISMILQKNFYQSSVSYGACGGEIGRGTVMVSGSISDGTIGIFH